MPVLHRVQALSSDCSSHSRVINCILQAAAALEQQAAAENLATGNKSTGSGDSAAVSKNEKLRGVSVMPN